MLCFEIIVNGQKVVVAGQKDALSLNAGVFYHRKHEDVCLNVEAIVWKEGTVGSHDNFWEAPVLKLGDEVQIRLVESETPDPPTWQDVTGVRIPPPWNGAEEKCSFCGADKKERNRLFEGPNVRICDACVQFRYLIVSGEVPNDGT